MLRDRCVYIYIYIYIYVVIHRHTFVVSQVFSADVVQSGCVKTSCLYYVACTTEFRIHTYIFQPLIIDVPVV